jgi:hypothetical protein
MTGLFLVHYCVSCYYMLLLKSKVTLIFQEVKMFFLDTANYSPFFVDLRPTQDDKKILRNPHKGWSIHYIDNGIARPFYRDSIAEGDTLLDFPYLNHMYLRFDWGDIEKEEGVYDWSYLDDIFDKWGKLGYRFSLRMCTYEGRDDNVCYPTPKWVFDKGAKHYDLNGIIEPDYDDPIYLEYLERFMTEYAKKYDGHPLVEFVDIGSFGTWGEGHTGDGIGREYRQSVVMKHIEMTLKYFKHTYVMLNDDMVRHGMESYRGEQSPEYFIDFCRMHGCGLRDDSIIVEYCSKTYGYDTLANPSMFDLFWKNAPIDIEFQHMRMVTPDMFRDGYPTLASLERSHATYACFHGEPRKWLRSCPEFNLYAGARLGYWYFPEGIILPEAVSNIPSYAELKISNRGFGLGYFDGELEFTLKDEGGKIYNLGRNPANNRTWMPGEASVVRAKMSFDSVPAGNYQLQLGLYEGERVIEMATFDKNTDNGRLIIDNITVR